MSEGYSVSSAFHSLPAEDRAAAKERACELHGVEDFYDLDPDQRREAYESALSAS